LFETVFVQTMRDITSHSMCQSVVL